MTQLSQDMGVTETCALMWCHSARGTTGHTSFFPRICWHIQPQRYFLVWGNILVFMMQWLAIPNVSNILDMQCVKVVWCQGSFLFSLCLPRGFLFNTLKTWQMSPGWSVPLANPNRIPQPPTHLPPYSPPTHLTHGGGEVGGG